MTAAHASSYEVDDISVFNTVNVEDYLNTLPQFVPSFDSSSNNPGDGSARLNLRGLGAERTLVLIDGRRFAPFGGSNIIDVNSIPAALVERVEILTGERAARYGSGAIGGIVNFVLKDDFEGVELNASHELSAAGWDANTTNISLAVGGNFGDGRGKTSFLASYTNRESLLQGKREFSQTTLTDPGPNGTALIETGSLITTLSARLRNIDSNNFGLTNLGINPGSPLPSTNANFPSNFFIEDLDPACGANNANQCSGVHIGLDGQTVLGFRSAGPNIDLYNYAPSNYLRLPQERYNIAGFASYEINDHIEAYMRGLFANTATATQLAPTPANLLLTVNLDSPFLTANSILLNLISGSRANLGNGTALLRIGKRYEESGFRRSAHDKTTFQLATGLRGDLNDVWSYDSYFGFSRSTNSEIFGGNISRSAVQAALLCDGGPTAVASGCAAPALNLFGGSGSISPAAAAFISRRAITVTEVEEIQWVGTLAGDLDSIRTPWAASGAAVVFGLEYREMFANSIPDSVLGPDVIGFNQTLPVRGRYDVYEAFGEVTIPVISGVTFIDSFSINGAYRYSDYSISNVGGVHTFSVGGDWSPIPELHFRAQFQRTARAPNISELFSQETNFFPGVSDPCLAGGGFAPPSPVTVSTCIAAGVPAAVIGTIFLPHSQVQVFKGGNPNLFQETADTLTIGMIWRPEIIDGLELRVDYYDIDVDAAIGPIPLQTVLNECHIVGIQEACDLLIGARDPTNGLLGVNGFIPRLGAVNIGNIQARGIDFDLGYSIGALGGTLNANYVGSYTLKSTSRASPLGLVVECAGAFAGFCGEPNPKYKHAAQIGYEKGPLSVNFRWRYLSGVTVETSFAGFVSDLSDHINSANYIDVETQYSLRNNLDISLGVRNITGETPPILGSTVAEQANTWPATYEHLGRQVFFGASLRF